MIMGADDRNFGQVNVAHGALISGGGRCLPRDGYSIYPWVLISSGKRIANSVRVAEKHAPSVVKFLSVKGNVTVTVF